MLWNQAAGNETKSRIFLARPSIRKDTSGLPHQPLNCSRCQRTRRRGKHKRHNHAETRFLRIGRSGHAAQFDPSESRHCRIRRRSRVLPEMHRDGTDDCVVACFGQARLTPALALGHSLRTLYRLPHAVWRRGHINAVDAEWTQRINDRIDDDGRSTDGA